MANIELGTLKAVDRYIQLLEAITFNLQKAITEGFADTKMGHADITYRDYYENEIKRLTPN